ncbi:MAG: hypothetical protein IMZ69_08115 [Spirochaetes bacterium]|nr:hypothetical protein [Spirochaetota bacterium]
MNTFWEKLAEAFQDQGGGVDLKLILGGPIVIVAVIFVIITRDLAVFGVIAGLGTGLILGSLAGDQGKLNVTSTPADPTQGVPQ